MIRVDTTGLDAQMKQLDAGKGGKLTFGNQTQELGSEWAKGAVVKQTDFDTGMALFVPGFESGRFKALWSKVNGFLCDKQYGKCGYCEAKMLPVSSADVEHFRPKAGFDPATGGMASANLAGVKGGLVRSGYFWLAYDAGNYYASCKICNEVYKKNRFDVAPGTPRATYGTPVTEVPMFIDPGREDPRQFIRFDPYTARAVPAAMWDEYVAAKGENDPLGERPAQLGTPTVEQVQEAIKFDAYSYYVVRDIAGPLRSFLDQCPKLKEGGPSRKATAHTQQLLSTQGTGSLDPEPGVQPATAQLSASRQMWLLVDTQLAEVRFGSPQFEELVLIASKRMLAEDVNRNQLGEDVLNSYAAKLRAIVLQQLRTHRLDQVRQYTLRRVLSDLGAGRALYSIFHLGLNRTELVRARAEHLAKIRGLFLFLKVARPGVDFVTAVLADEQKDPPTSTSDAPDEMQAAFDTLRYAVSRAGAFASLTIDALIVWRGELVNTSPGVQQVQMNVNTPMEPWLYRYLEIAARPLRPDDDPDEDDADDDDTTASAGDEPDPTLVPMTRDEDTFFLCALQRFGQKLTLFKSRYSLNVAEQDLIAGVVMRTSATYTPACEALFQAEVLRLLNFYGSADEIVRSAYLPLWSAARWSQDPSAGYWGWVDGELSKLDPSYNQPALSAALAAIRQKSGSFQSPGLDKAAVQKWWKQAFPRKKTFPQGLQ